MAYRQRPGQADSSDHPKRLPPVMEKYAGKNLPWRGTQDHGVPIADHTPGDVLESEHPWVDEKADIDYLPPENEPVPILVRVVNEHARELKDWRVGRSSVSTQAVQIVGKNMARKGLRIRNLDAANAVYIGPDSSVSTYTGYKIPAGTEPMPFVTTEEVWATTGDATVVEIGLLYEFSVEL